MSATAFLAAALGVAESDIAADATLGHPAAWDSIGHMRLILALENRLDRELNTAEIMTIDGLDVIAGLLGE